MNKDKTVVVSLAFGPADVRRRGGLVAHPRIWTRGWTVSTESGFTLGSVCFDDIETADEFAKRVARFRLPWRTMTPTQWATNRPRIGKKLADIARELGGHGGQAQ